jgi:toxin CptA
MSGKDIEKITIRLGISRRLAALLLIFHGSAMALLPFLPIPFLITWVLALLVTGSLAYYWRLELLREGPRAVKVLEWNGKEEWLLTGPDGIEQTAVLDGSSYLHPKLMVLNFTLSEGGRRHVILLPDSIDPSLFRRLSVRLKLGDR